MKEVGEPSLKDVERAFQDLLDGTRSRSAIQEWAMGFAPSAVENQAVAWGLNMLGCADNQHDLGYWFDDADYRQAFDRFQARAHCEPDLREKWAALRVAWHRFDLVTGRIVEFRHFGAFVDLGTPFLGLIEVIDAPDDEYERLQVGNVVEAAIRGFVGHWARQVKLSMRPEDVSRSERHAPVENAFAGNIASFSRDCGE